MIKLDVTKSTINVREREKIVSGSVNTYLCQFNFFSDWDGLDITAVFQAGPVTKVVVLAGETSCIVPWEVLVNDGVTLNVGVFGTNAGNVVLQPTTMAQIGTIQKGTPEGDAGQEPTPDVYAQIYAEAQDAKAIAQSVRDAAASGAFDGAVGPQGPEGKQGPQGQTGNDGRGGGYYTPVIVQPSEDVMTVGYDPSAEDMPAVGPVTVTLQRGPRGYSGLVPAVTVPWASEITVGANLKTTIGTLEEATTITLGESVEGYDNEWPFIVAQGETAYDIVLPVIEWHGGYAPVFGAGSRTEVRLWYDGDVLKGVWL